MNRKKKLNRKKEKQKTKDIQAEERTKEKVGTWQKGYIRCSEPQG